VRVTAVKVAEAPRRPGLTVAAESCGVDVQLSLVAAAENISVRIATHVAIAVTFPDVDSEMLGSILVERSEALVPSSGRRADCRVAAAVAAAVATAVTPVTANSFRCRVSALVAILDLVRWRRRIRHHRLLLLCGVCGQR
jgi:hypothetical protein